MGCKAFTPPLVGLANELRGELFHLVASHNQDGGPSHVVHEIFQNGLDLDSPNVSVTKFGHHPGVEGTGFVPYYMLFDHHGDLVRHHQGGPYHGGDGLSVLNRIRSMLKDVPALYVGKEPYTRHKDLAQRLQSTQSLQADLELLQTKLAENPEDEELTRLSHWVARYVQRRTQEIEHRLSVDPEGAQAELQTSLQTFKGSSFGAALMALHTSLQDADMKKRYHDGAAHLNHALRGWSNLSPIQGNRDPVLNPLDLEFRNANGDALRRVAQHLRHAVEFPDLPAGRRANEMLRVLGDL